MCPSISLESQRSVLPPKKTDLFFFGIPYLPVRITKMRILMCCHLPLTSTLGGAKVYLEAAECYRRAGHDVELVGIDGIVGKDRPVMSEPWRLENFPDSLKKYIEQRINQFDVVEFEVPYLPFEIKRPKGKLLIARSVLLDLHLKEIKIPRFKGLKAILGFIFKSRKRNNQLNKKIEMILKAIQFADGINVPNPDDKEILLKFGIPEEKIIVQPYGIFESRKVTLQKAHQYNSSNIKHKIAFVGTFDNRKGAVEFPEIIKQIVHKHPNIKFKFLGVFAMFTSEEMILNHLGNQYANNVEIIGKFNSDDLPSLLSDCTIGIFPSYLESFGFGALEMMAAGMPVIGYSCPGVRSLLPKENLVPRGDVKSLIHRLLKLIEDSGHYQNCKHQLKSSVDEFIYEKQINRAIETYVKNLQR